MEKDKNINIISADEGIRNICLNSIALIKHSRKIAVKSVNSIQLLTYYIMGMWLVEEQQKGEKRAGYGDELLKTLSKALTEEFGKGFSKSSLDNFRKFYIVYKDRINQPVVGNYITTIFQPLVGKSNTKEGNSLDSELNELPFYLDWSHYLILMRISSKEERDFYEIESRNENWSKRELQRQYNSSLYERLALSKDKKGLIELSKSGYVIEKPEDIIKQPTVLEFLGLDEKEHYLESDLETAVLDKLQKFLLEMGKGYLFEKRQKRFTFNEDNYYVDLVLYNRLLKCYVLVDFKIDKITHQDLGQMQMYVNYYDRYEKKEFENPTIGILLCKEKNDALIELTLPENANIYATEYKLYLPDKNELKKKLSEWIDEIDNGE